MTQVALLEKGPSESILLGIMTVLKCIYMEHIYINK